MGLCTPCAGTRPGAAASAASRVPATVRASKKGYLVDIWLAGIQKSIQKYGGE